MNTLVIRFFFVGFLIILGNVDYLKALNILFVTRHFPHPSQFFIRDPFIEMMRRGHNVYMHALKEKQDSNSELDITDSNLLKRISYGKTIPNCYMFDIIYVQFGYHGAYVVSQLRKQKYKGKIIVCFRGNDLSGRLHEDYHLYDNLFKEVDLFLPVCDFFKQRLIQIGCKKSKIKVLHSAIDISKFPFNKKIMQYEKRLKIASISRILEKKGLEYVIKAVAMLKQQYPYIQYLIVGNSVNGEKSLEYKEYLKNLIKELKLEKQVLFYGWLAHEKIATFLEDVDIFLLTSVTASDGDQEGIPNSLKEAMASGVPVIATHHSGNIELVENKVTGLIVPEKDVESIVNSVQWYINHPKEVALITLAARDKVEKEFNIVPVVTTLEQICNDLLKN